MSFICDVCKRPMRNGSKPVHIIKKTRDVVYPERRNEKNEVVDRGGVGWETVNEVKACKKCAGDIERDNQTEVIQE